VDNKSGVVGGT